MAIIKVEDLKMHYKTKMGYVKAVDGISFELEEGGSLGIVGESGCGKTSVSMTLLRTLPENAHFMGGHVWFNDNGNIVDLAQLSENEMRHYRWKGISMVFQAAMNSLNPVYKVSDQIIEAILTHYPDTPIDEARKKVERLFELVTLDPKRMDEYPHQYSGGMKQRAVIALALACDPKIIIADEPTTALDVIVQDKILRELKKVQDQLNMAMIYISHDIAVIAEVSEKIAVMYAGKFVEQSDSTTVFKHPMHPYTFLLMNAFPSHVGEKKKLFTIPGEPPNLLNPPTGCRFAPRCPWVTDKCLNEEPPYIEIEKGHFLACWHPLTEEVRQNELRK
ncbi:MAG TPA: ABC transporter ATP-binding protein [Fervidobacterium sp.]|nr:dipeptide/oligopeptide/nickel ABC transporter ATP-binding protein [Fervidobacterium sp.]HOK87940.1 ABC transporter ATP-binding protein [Fervidobacterium sp.]HOM74315.1 ABC transporter ATP-binding protein [Fervidobacterium sp.]HOQ39888.1 ABC transporter ATP-binding protein [Fervidobacterium sp.]HPP18002.1 ABC transporter ATP-binding protein [Fervidobacterium sp.]